MTLGTIQQLKNTFGVISFFLILTLIIFKPNDISIPLIQTLLVLFIPLGITDLVWNERAYNGLMHNEATLYRKMNFSYRSFQLFGFILSMLFMIMLFAVLIEYILTGNYRFYK